MSDSNSIHLKPGVTLQLIQYNESSCKEVSIDNLWDINEVLKSSDVNWIDIDGTHCSKTLQHLAETLHLHPLLVEDILHHDHRPKLDEYDHHLYIIVKMLDFNSTSSKIITEQVSFILGKNYLISIQETGKKGDIFGPIRSRLRNDQGKHRKFGADYLLYSLLDIIVDHYFTILEKIGERIETLEDDIINHPTSKKLNEIYVLKRELIVLRRSVWPLREVLNKLDKDSVDFVKPPVHLYVREAYDHTIQVIETLESYRDILSGLIDIYLSSLSNKMNSIMKVLTIISTIFMPITFISGVYGMNFDYMPLKDSPIGYFIIMGGCFSIVGIMLFYFKTKKWL